MRPVNLIPLEERRGEHAPTRTGPLAYLVVGALVVALAGVTALVLTANQISERKSEVTTLEGEDAEARAEVERLAAYVQFRMMREERIATVASLADSRFDWERVMRELSLILPSDVWLLTLEATASPEASSGGGGSDSAGGLRADAPGPALAIGGCASGHEAVARFVTALKDIDGVTRVGVESSALPEGQSGAGVSSEGAESPGEGSGEGESASGSCPARASVAQFSLVVAFDAAPVPLASAEAADVPVASAPEEEASSTETPEGG
jgi:Tfp pilus assembly protein PilN